MKFATPHLFPIYLLILQMQRLPSLNGLSIELVLDIVNIPLIYTHMHLECIFKCAQLFAKGLVPDQRPTSDKLIMGYSGNHE